MADAITQESWVWTSSGTEPAQGDEDYVPGKQPIAEYDNWAMWAVTTDIENLNDTLGNHNSFHETGGQDEMDLGDLWFDDLIQIHNPSADTSQIKDDDGDVLIEFDTANNTIPSIVEITDTLSLSGTTNFTGDVNINGNTVDYGEGTLKNASQIIGDEIQADAGFVIEQTHQSSESYTIPLDYSMDIGKEYTVEGTLTVDGSLTVH